MLSLEHTCSKSASWHINSFGAIGDYSRPLVDRYCGL